MNGEGLIGCVAKAWSPKIGDPNATGWLTVMAYLLCLVLAIAVWRRLQGQRGRGFWGMIAALMLFLAINKQLDLQSALTAAGRCLAHAHGWYENRRLVQEAFILGLLGLACGGLVVGLLRLRGQWRRHGLALVGLTVLAGFVMVRAVGFHHFDRLIGVQQFGVSANYLFENAGLLMIALNAVAILRHRQRRALSLS